MKTTNAKSERAEPRQEKGSQVGEIPEGWETTTLGDVITFHRGYDLPKSKFKNGAYPIAGSNGVIGYHDVYTTKGPGITIGRSGNIGTPYFYKGDFWAHNTTLFVEKFHNVDPKFIYYLLQTLDFSGHNSGSAVPSLNRNFIHPIEVIVSNDITEQRAIAKILSDLDDKIELNHRMNKTLESLAQTIFKRRFVDFEIPRCEKIKIVNGLPDGWRISKLGDFAEIRNGFAFKSEDFMDSGIFLLRTRNFTENGYIVRDDTACLPQNFYDEYKDFRLKKFDVLLGVNAFLSWNSSGFSHHF